MPGRRPLKSLSSRERSCTLPPVLIASALYLAQFHPYFNPFMIVLLSAK